MNVSSLILTDSDEIQEEAPSLGKQILVLRKTTERPEAIEAGIVKFIGTDTATIVYETSRMLGRQEVYSQMTNAINSYGNDKPREKPLTIILSKFR